MATGLTALYALKDSLIKELEATIQDLPVKQDLDAVERIIAQREGKRLAPRSITPCPKSDAKKPRTLADETVKKTVLAWAEKHFLQTENQTTGFRQLTDSMLADGVYIPGDKPVFVVSGIITRNKKFTGQNSQWHLAEYVR